MSKHEPAEEHCARSGDWPKPTHWSVVLAAANPNAPGARSALESLCETYWYPVYAYVRHRLQKPADAEDLTQAFFLHLLESGVLATTRPERGRFRSFLRVCLDNFLASQWRSAHAEKRGGRFRFVTWDPVWAERHYEAQHQINLPPEQLYDRNWALTVLQRVLDRLRSEMTPESDAQLFDHLKDRLLDDDGTASYAETSRQLGVAEATLRKTVSRLRRRYGELLQHEVAQTVASPSDVEGELRHLLAVVSA